jgi:hypothetical protein
MGEVQVPDKYWGTKRDLEIILKLVHPPDEIIEGFAYLKKGSIH